jgi:hypothetical protein
LKTSEKRIVPPRHPSCSSTSTSFFIQFLYLNPIEGGDIMKKIAIELLIVAATVAAYVLPVLADGGGW